MRIGIDISRLAAAQRTGTEQYTAELVAALARSAGRHHWTLYANRRPPSLPPLPPNWTLRSIPFPRLWTHLRLSAEMLHAAPDLLFVPAHVLPLVHPRRTVVTIHDLGYMHHPQAHPPWPRLYLRLSTRWNVRRATHLIADSEATKRDLMRFEGVAADKITVVYLGISPRFRPVTDPLTLRMIAQRHGIRAPYVLFIGTIQPRKNLVRLIDAFAEAALPDTRLVIVGKRGWGTAEIEARAAERGIADRVQFTGYVADADVPALISGARALALPSLYEGFGLPAAEALVCGTPVVAANVASLPEVVGDAGLLVDPLDTAAIAHALHRIATDDVLHAELRERGLARAAAWTWERCAAETLAVLERAAG